jgi:hypothetical protein
VAEKCENRRVLLFYWFWFLVMVSRRRACAGGGCAAMSVASVGYRVAGRLTGAERAFDRAGGDAQRK